MVAACVAGPCLLVFSTPPFHTGLWPQNEPVFAALNATAAVAALGLALALMGGSPAVTAALRHPFTLIPLAVAGWSLLLMPIHRIPLLSWFGTPEFGQGIAWHFDFALIVAAGLVVLRMPGPRRILGWTCVVAVAVVASTMIHTDKGWWLAPFLFYDALAYYGLFVTPLLLVLFAPRQWRWRLAIIAFGFIVIMISGNRSALLLSVLAVPIAAFLMWLNTWRPNWLRPLAILGTAVAPLLTTGAVYFVGEGLQDGSLWSRMLHIEVARLSLSHEPIAALVGGGWGSYGEWQLAHLPIGQFDFFGHEEIRADWDGARGELHFQSHNFLIEALLSGGVVAAGLVWLGLVALPAFCRRRYLVIAGTLGAVGAALMAVWAPDAGAVPYIALTYAAVAMPCRAPIPAIPLRIVIGLGFLTAGTAVALTCFTILRDGQVMYQAAHDNRDTAGLSTTAHDACDTLFPDSGRGGVHLASLYRNFSIELANKLALSKRLTETDAVRMADYVCAADHMIGERTSLRLANADLMVTADLITILDFPILEPVAAQLTARWGQRLHWFLERSPTRSDVTVPYLSWHFANGRESEVSDVTAKLLARNRDDPVGLWFSGAVLLGDEATAETGFARMRDALEHGLEKIMPVDPDIAKQIRTSQAGN